MDGRAVRAMDGRRAGTSHAAGSRDPKEGEVMANRVQKGEVEKRGRCEVHTDAPIDAVWDVVRDVTRTGEWSHECLSVEWLDGATEARPGARFRGKNKARMFRWGRVCEVVSSDSY